MALRDSWGNLGSLRMKKCRRTPKSPRVEAGNAVPAPEQVALPPYEPKAPLYTKYKSALFVVASSDTKQRHEFNKALKQCERLIVERLDKMVCREMEMRVYMTDRAVAMGKYPDEAELTDLQKKAAECAHSAQDVIALPPPFSSTPRKVSDPRAMPATVSISSFSYDEVDTAEDWETVDNLTAYFEFFGHTIPPPTPRRLSRMPARALGSIRTRGKNVPIKKDGDGPNVVNENYREVVDDFIAQETAYFARRNKPAIATSSPGKDGSGRISRKSISLRHSISVTSSSRGNDDSWDSYVTDIASQMSVNNVSNDITPLLHISSNSTTIRNEIFDGKDGALQTKELASDFRNSASAPERLTRSKTIDFQPGMVDVSKSLPALPSSRPAPSALVNDEETPKRVTTSFVGGMKRVDTMSNFRAMRGGSSRSDLYSNADDIASPVPFSTTIAAGDNARNRRLGRVQQDEDIWTSSPRNSVVELNEQAIVAMRLAEQARKAEEEKQMTLEKERRKQQKKAKLQSKIQATEQLLKQVEEKYNRQRQSLENLDRDGYSSPKDEDSSPLPIGKHGSQVFLRRNQLTHFSESSLFSDDMRTPKQTRAVNNLNALFSSPQRKSSPLAQPPMNVTGSKSMSDMSRSELAETTLTTKSLYDFPLPPSGGNKLQNEQPIPNALDMAHASSDDIVPSSPSNKFGSVGQRGKWKGKGCVRSRVENLFSDDAVPCVNKRLSRVPKPLDPRSPLMAMLQGQPITPSGALPESALSPIESAPGMIRTDEDGMISLGHNKDRKRSTSEASKLKDLYVDHIDGHGAYSAPAISSDVDVAPPAPVSILANLSGVHRETSSQSLTSQHTFADLIVEMNKPTTDDKASISVDEDGDKFYSAHSSPQTLHFENFSNTLPSQTSDRFRSSSGVVLSMKDLELHGAESLPVWFGETPRPHHSPIPDTTSECTPTRRTFLSVPNTGPSSSSPSSRIIIAPESPEMAVQRGVRSFLPASRTIPRSLVAQSTITRTDDGPIIRSPEKGPYMDRSGPSMYRLNSMLKMPEAGDDDPFSFVRNAKKAVEWAEKDGKRFSRVYEAHVFFASGIWAGWRKKVTSVRLLKQRMMTPEWA